MVSIIFTLGQVLAVMALIYGAILVLSHRHLFQSEVGSALQRVDQLADTVERSVELGKLARTDINRAARARPQDLLPLTRGT